jgi:hypothetical protein
VSAVSPNSGPTSGGTAITITGTGFVTGATVKIGQGNGAGAGAIAATNVVVVSSTQITAVTGGGAKVGTFSLFVITSAGTSAANSGDTSPTTDSTTRCRLFLPLSGQSALGGNSADSPSYS